MKNHSILAVFAAFILAGCGSSDSPTPAPADTSPVAKSSAPSGEPAVKVAYDEGSIKKGDMAHCVICVTNEGSKAEEAVHEVLNYQGKTYAFCNENEKAEFISNPTKYASK